MKVKDLIRELEAQEWVLDRIRGSHHIFVHGGAIRSITVPVHGKDIPDHFAKGILQQAKRALQKERR